MPLCSIPVTIIQPEKSAHNNDEENTALSALSCFFPELTEKEKLENELKEAIKEERYEDAAKIRDEIKKLD